MTGHGSADGHQRLSTARVVAAAVLGGLSAFAAFVIVLAGTIVASIASTDPMSTLDNQDRHVDVAAETAMAGTANRLAAVVFVVGAGGAAVVLVRRRKAAASLAATVLLAATLTYLCSPAPVPPVPPPESAAAMRRAGLAVTATQPTQLWLDTNGTSGRGPMRWPLSGAHPQQDSEAATRAAYRLVATGAKRVTLDGTTVGFDGGQGCCHLEFTEAGRFLAAAGAPGPPLVALPAPQRLVPARLLSGLPVPSASGHEVAGASRQEVSARAVVLSSGEMRADAVVAVLYRGDIADYAAFAYGHAQVHPGDVIEILAPNSGAFWPLAPPTGRVRPPGRLTDWVAGVWAHAEGLVVFALNDEGVRVDATVEGADPPRWELELGIGRWRLTRTARFNGVDISATQVVEVTR